MQESGINNVTLKNRNRGMVLRLVITGECTSRIEIARHTGLSKMAATNIIGQLIEEGIFEEQETIRVKGKGRNPIQLALSPMAPKMIGVYVRSNECSVFLGDMYLKVLAKTRFAITKENQDRLVEMICRCVDRILKRAEGERIWGISISSPAPMDLEKGCIHKPLDRFGTDFIPIVRPLEEKYEMPVYLENRYYSAAIAEKYFGNAREASDFLFVGVGEDVGSGIVAGGTLTESASGMRGDFGHFSLDTKGRLCKCGRRGCLEMYVSTPQVRLRYRKVSGQEAAFREICRSAEKKDPVAQGVLEDMCDYLSYGLVSAVNLLAPQKIIIGFDGGALPASFLTRVEETVNRDRLPGKFIPVQSSAFGRDAGLRGCTANLLMHIFNGLL